MYKLCDVLQMLIAIPKFSIGDCMTSFRKTNPNCIFDISRVTDLKYLTHCESFVLGFSHANYRLQYDYSSYLASIL